MFEALVSSIDELTRGGPSDHPCGETLEVLQRQRNRLDYAMAVEVAAFDADKAWSPDGAYNAAAWLATKLRIPRRDAHAFVRLGRAARDMPLVAAAWSAGDIGVVQVDLLNKARRPATAEAFARDEASLVERAMTLTHHQFRCVMRVWDEDADPDRAEERAENQHADREVYLSQSYEDMWFLDGKLDPVGGLIVADELHRLERKQFRAEWKEAKKRLGRKPLFDELTRTPAQRRADALVEMAARSRAMPKGARKPEPLFTVVVGKAAFDRICELHNRTVTTPGSMVRWLSKAWIERVVFGPASRPIDVGRHRRLFSKAQARAVRVREPECSHECCERPAIDCQIDHIEPYAAGGPTIEPNGRPLCAFHNQLRNRREHPQRRERPPDDPGPAP